MRLRSHLIGIASVATLVAFAGANALAQGSYGSPTDKTTKSQSTTQSTTGAQTSGSQSTTKSSGANAPSSGPWTADNVTAARPFGDININAAGTTQQSVMVWVQQRTPAERAELTGRCQVITNASNASHYTADAQQFCRNYMMVASANPSSGKGSTTAK